MIQQFMSYFKDKKMYSTIEKQIKKLRQFPSLLADSKLFNEEAIIAVLKENPEAIKYLKCPNKQMQEAAVYENPDSIRYIKNPSNKLIDYAISKNPTLVKYINFFDEELIIKALRINPMAIHYVPFDKQNDRIQRYAIKHYTGSFIEDLLYVLDPKILSIDNKIKLIKRDPKIINKFSTKDINYILTYKDASLGSRLCLKRKNELKEYQKSLKDTQLSDIDIQPYTNSSNISFENSSKVSDNCLDEFYETLTIAQEEFRKSTNINLLENSDIKVTSYKKL